MNKRYTPTCFFAHIGVYQHRSPSVPETGKRQRGYVYPQRIGCGEHRFNRGLRVKKCVRNRGFSRIDL